MSSLSTFNIQHFNSFRRPLFKLFEYFIRYLNLKAFSKRLLNSYKNLRQALYYKATSTLAALFHIKRLPWYRFMLNATENSLTNTLATNFQKKSFYLLFFNNGARLQAVINRQQVSNRTWHQPLTRSKASATSKVRRETSNWGVGFIPPIMTKLD